MPRGKQMMNDINQECRMRFGRALKYDPSGETNFTEGIEPHNTGCVVIDGNQQPKFTTKRKHPRNFQRTTCSMY